MDGHNIRHEKRKQQSEAQPLTQASGIAGPVHPVPEVCSSEHHQGDDEQAQISTGVSDVRGLVAVVHGWIGSRRAEHRVSGIVAGNDRSRFCAQSAGNAGSVEDSRHAADERHKGLSCRHGRRRSRRNDDSRVVRVDDGNLNSTRRETSDS